MRQSRIHRLVASGLVAVSWGTASLSAAPTEAKLIKAVVVNMGDDATVTAPRYDNLYVGGSAKAGVQAIIAAGQFVINGFPVPGNEAAYQAQYPKGYTVNQTVWLAPSGTQWAGGLANQQGTPTFPTFTEAALAAATAIPAGLEVRLFDTNGDGLVDRIETQYLEALLVGAIEDKNDGTYQVHTGSFSSTIPASKTDGRPWDNKHFTPTSGDTVTKSHFDPTIRVGDVALFWFGPDGWAFQRAIEVVGVLVDGADHQFYQVDTVKYLDAMRFSRDGLSISNRPGEFVNAQKYFGLNKPSDQTKISLWLSPTTGYPTVKGAPIGFTTGGNAAPFLTTALAIAQKKLDAAPTAPVAARAELKAAIARAQGALKSAVPSAQLDYQVYLLYLTLNGTKDDIGASFAGYQYQGFNRQVN